MDAIDSEVLAVHCSCCPLARLLRGRIRQGPPKFPQGQDDSSTSSSDPPEQDAGEDLDHTDGSSSGRGDEAGSLLDFVVYSTDDMTDNTDGEDGDPDSDDTTSNYSPWVEHSDSTYFSNDESVAAPETASPTIDLSPISV